MKLLKKFIIYAGIFLSCNQTTLASRFAQEDQSIITSLKQTAQDIITNIASQPLLPYPYSTLKQDPVSGAYVLIASSTYTFFNAPNNYTDASGNSIRSAAIYDTHGNLQTVIQGVPLISLLAQYGVYIDELGNQYLGACNLQPLMMLDPADTKLSPGQSGNSMICSNSEIFPSQNIASPITYKNSKFYFYYNTIMQAYFVMQINGSTANYIHMKNGYVYNLDGSNAITGTVVGCPNNGSLTNFFLPYLNASGDLQCFMECNANSGSYTNFKSITPKQSSYSSSYDTPSTTYDPATKKKATLNALVGLSAPYNNVAVYQIPPSKSLSTLPDFITQTQYNVYWDQKKPTIYTTNAIYQAQNLQLLPIDMNSHTLSSITPSSDYNTATIILKNNNIYAFIIGNQFFTATPRAMNSYQLTSATNELTLSIQTDATTNVKYVAVSSNSITYNYQYPFLTLSPTQLQDYQSNAWQLEQVYDNSGELLLIKRLPINSNGNVQLSPITTKNILNVPTNRQAINILNNTTTVIAQDTKNNRYLTMVYPAGGFQKPSYSYLKQNCYVDMATGILFNLQGIATGQLLKYSDLKALLDQLSVAITQVNNKAVLSYNAATSILPDENNNQVDLLSSSVSTSVQVNPQIELINQQNVELLKDIANRQGYLNSISNPHNDPNIANKLMICKNAIEADTQQVAMNNTLLASLQESESTTTSTN